MKKENPKSTLQLPQQMLYWKLIPKNTQKIFLQFDITVRDNGTKKFGLVAYPAYKSGKTWNIGKKITLENKKGAKQKRLPLPITLGNLELKCSDLQKMKLTKDSILFFTPRYYEKNPHASYSVSDDAFQGQATANPSPPARPMEA